jgi:hypothetical protein
LEPNPVQSAKNDPPMQAGNLRLWPEVIESRSECHACVAFLPATSPGLQHPVVSSGWALKHQVFHLTRSASLGSAHNDRVEAPAGRAPIQPGMSSPVAPHDLLAMWRWFRGRTDVVQIARCLNAVRMTERQLRTPETENGRRVKRCSLMRNFRNPEILVVHSAILTRRYQDVILVGPTVI